MVAGTFSIGGGKCLSITTENSMVKAKLFVVTLLSHRWQELLHITAKRPVSMVRADLSAFHAWHKSCVKSGVRLHE